MSTHDATMRTDTEAITDRRANNVKTASIYSIASHHSRAVEHQLAQLLAEVRKGEIRGVTYAVSDRNNELAVGFSGSHSDPDKAIGSLFRAAMILVLAPMTE